MKRNILFEELRAAFPSTPIDGTTAFEQRGIAYCDTSEYRRQMHGKTWEQLDPVFFARRSDGMSFLNTTHFVAVLPHYLHLLLVFGDGSPVAESLPSKLIQPRREDINDVTWDNASVTPTEYFEWQHRFFDELTSVLSHSQCEVVAATLRAYVASAFVHAEFAQRALERYWYRFLPGVGEAPSTFAMLKPNPLLSRLREAFPPTAIDVSDVNERSFFEAEEYRQIVDGKAWDELDPLAMARHSGAIDFVRPAHAVAVLPHLLHLLIVFDSPHVAERVLSKLTKPVKGDEYFHSRELRFEPFVDLLTAPQKAVVAATLLAFIEKRTREAKAAQQALDRYWGQFLA